MHQGHRTRKRSHLSPQPHTPWRMSLNSTMPPSPSKAWRPGVLRTRSPSSLITRSSSSASADPPCSRAPALAGVRKGQRVLGQILRRCPPDQRFWRRRHEGDRTPGFKSRFSVIPTEPTFPHCALSSSSVKWGPIHVVWQGETPQCSQSVACVAYVASAVGGTFWLYYILEFYLYILKNIC